MTSNEKNEATTESERACEVLNTKLNDLLRRAVYESLCHFGGDRAAESLQYIMELEHSVDIKNPLDNIQSMRLGLKAMFGKAYIVIKDQTRGNLAKQLRLALEGRSIEQLIEEARNPC